MGDRYYITVQCPICKAEEEEVYFAPTCGFVSWTCPKCSHEVDLCEETGISYEDASNVDLIAEVVKSIS
jgi:transposase-like protein